MKITIDYSETEVQTLKMKSARLLRDFKIKINFSDGSEKTVDFKPFLSKSNHPSIKKYLDETKFAQFELKEGNLNWNDYEMIFPIEDLYEGKI